MRAITLLVGAAVLTVACGGGSGSGPTPTSPAPIPVADTCNSLGGTAASSGVQILNGATCSPDRSSIVLLNMRGEFNNPVGACTGTVVTPRTVLTAAHCLDGEVTRVRVWLGSGEEIEAESFVFYPNYQFNTPGSFDVGVVRLSVDLPRVSIPILTSRDARVGETAILAGWGRDENNSTATLRAGSSSVSAVTSTLIQTLYAPPSSSVCSGDSGGPILLQEGGTWTIGGITSATTQSACNTGTNFFQAVRHPSVIGFIREHVSGFGER